MKNLMKAVLQFQKTCPRIVKDKLNPHFRNNYADLASIIETIYPKLIENGLTVIQPIIGADTGVSLKTILFHESGEFVESILPLPANLTPQQLGSCLTYYRRYALLAILGIVASDEDDDGNHTQPTPVQPKEVYKPNLASKPQLNAIATICAKKNLRVENPEKMTSQQASEWIKRNGGN